MKKIMALSLAALFCVTALSGCTSSSYAIHTNDGRTIISDGKPKEDAKTGLIAYTDANGTEQQINKGDVKELSELPK
ncbi:lipoprotein [Erwinia rhapontici]|uniref:Lipoprotein n=1 Tax=Erwinia rhapontici TaxID=55212 RepID=A0ABN6DIY5_ERWRD|nr:YgdI/YgdR family lipoprotein [Erwinia rhapontici]BCQ34619.1 lipoprotein [Erwinia rhapontici]BCQ44650.1 lipoprotein [Erwinia rhapontici]